MWRRACLALCLSASACSVLLDPGYLGGGSAVVDRRDAAGGEGDAALEASGGCTVDGDCPQPATACQVVRCDATARACLPAEPYGFEVSSFPVATGDCTGLESPGCLAVIPPYLFVTGSLGTYAYDVRAPTAANRPGQLVFEAGAGSYQIMVAGRHLWVQGEPSAGALVVAETEVPETFSSSLAPLKPRTVPFRSGANNLNRSGGPRQGRTGLPDGQLALLASYNDGTEKNSVSLFAAGDAGGPKMMTLPASLGGDSELAVSGDRLLTALRNVGFLVLGSDLVAGPSVGSFDAVVPTPQLAAATDRSGVVVGLKQVRTSPRAPNRLKST